MKSASQPSALWVILHIAIARRSATTPLTSAAKKVAGMNRANHRIGSISIEVGRTLGDTDARPFAEFPRDARSGGC